MRERSAKLGHEQHARNCLEAAKTVFEGGAQFADQQNGLAG